MLLIKKLILVCIATLLVVSCGGGGDATATGSTAQPQPVTPTVTGHSIGGVVRGLSGQQSLLLQNNGTDDLIITADNNNRTFTFATRVSQTYAVTVAASPAGRLCTVTSGAGTAQADVLSVEVSCVTQTYYISFSVQGLAMNEAVTLQNNGQNTYQINANGSYTFGVPVEHGASYAVTVQTAPAGKVCTVSRGAGNNLSAAVDDVVVTCAPRILAAVNTTLKTSGGKLLDAALQNIVLRGVNVPVYKSGWSDDLARVIPAVKSSGANAVRIVWWSTPVGGAPNYTLPQFEDAIRTVANAGMLPIIELHDVTCFLAVPQASCNDTAIFKTRITDFWTRADVMAVLKKYQGYLIVNLANEWGRLSSESADASAFIAHYASTVQSVRTAWTTAGLDNIPIMIDAPNGGSYSGVFLAQHASGISNGQYLINSDPLKNIIFSAHAYWPTSEGHTVASIIARLQALATSGLPIVLGEVASNANGSCGNIDEVPWRTVMQQAASLGLGSMAWAWYEDSCAAMNLTDGTTLPTNDGTDDFKHRMLYDAAYGLAAAQVIPSYGMSAGYHAMTAQVDWSLCDGGRALAQGADYVSNSNCQFNAVTYSGLVEAKAYIDSQRITSLGWGDWRYISDLQKKVTDLYLLRTANCHAALDTLRLVGGGARGDQLSVQAKSSSINNVVSLVGGRNKDLTALFQYSLSQGVWSCN